MGKTPQEEPTPEFRKDPERQDLQALVKHVGSAIAAPAAAQASIASIDQFLNNLEGQLRKGNDVPRDRILRNADLAREHLRLAYNDLAEATAPEQLPEARDKLKEIAEELPPLLERNRAAVDRLVLVADSARATVGAMVLAPPESPGQPVPLASLGVIEPLRPELLILRERLKAVVKKVNKAKAFVLRAKASSETVEALAQLAEKLDDDALGHLSERRTRGVPAQYSSQMLSREVILNANKWLKHAVKKGEELVKRMEEQVDPKKEGIQRALAAAFEADRKTQNGKELVTRSGNRINYNHKMRLNDVIAHGYDVASDTRKPWWVGRARMAKNEGVVDSGKMDEASREAEEAAHTAEQVLKASVAEVERIDQELGRSEGRDRKLVKRELDVPAPRDIKGKANPANVKVVSKPLKIPRTLEVSDEEIMGSYDTDPLPH